MTGEEDGWTRGNREREVVYARQRQRGSNIDGGTESVNVPTEGFDSWSHKQIKAASDAFEPGKAIEASKDWEKLATGFSKALDDFKHTFDAAVGAQWTGEGAEAAKQGISDYKSHAEQVSDGLSLMATKPQEVETAMTQIKSLMPDPVEVQPLTTGASRAQVEQHFADQALGQQKQDEARMIMRNVWSPVSQQAASGLPTLPAAPQFGDASAVNAITKAASDWGGGKDIKPDTVKPIDEASVRAAAAAALADPMQSSSGGGSGAAGAAAAAAGAAGGASGAGGGGPAAAAASAAGAAGGAGTRPTSGGGTTATGPNTGSVPGTYGIGRWGKPTTNKDENKDKDKESDFSPLAAGPIIAGSYTAGAGMGLAAAPSPMQGMGIAQPPTMMTPGAAGAHQHQEDEDQHFTPEFLVSIDNGNELVGPLPKVSPAVIGVWNEEHVAYQNPHPSVYDPKPYDGDD
ncbi:PPE domain-containing protein [Mycobacteroides sp. LB1]|uniref:PPE domain-containing protein n=1 Tax=Mycobacteroides sp. LB1 TaxID=2750814 RepID=UPI0015E05A12|nr:PPE domain-containing protein [Mycobacteroides sp. LB1]